MFQKDHNLVKKSELESKFLCTDVKRQPIVCLFDFLQGLQFGPAIGSISRKSIGLITAYIRNELIEISIRIERILPTACL